MQLQMRCYQVESETLTDYGGWDDAPEQYRIVELVIARNRHQAKRLACIEADTESHPPDMPRCSVRVVGFDVPPCQEPRIVSSEEPYLDWFYRFRHERQGEQVPGWAANAAGHLALIWEMQESAEESLFVDMDPESVAEAKSIAEAESHYARYGEGM